VPRVMNPAQRRLFLACVDLGALVTSACLGFAVFYAIRAVTVFSFWWLGVFAVTTVAAVFWFWTKGHYSRRRPFWDEYREVVQGLLALGIGASSLLFLTKSQMPRIWFAAAFVLSFVMVPLMRYLAKKILLSLGQWQHPTVIVGIGRNAVEAVRALKSEALMGFRIDCLVALERKNIPEEGFLEIDDVRYPVISLGDSPGESIQEFGDPNVVIALESGGVNANPELIETLSRYAYDLYVVPAFKGLPLQGMEASYFFRHESLFLRVKNNLSRPSLITLKRTLDISGSLFLLGILAPVFLVFSLIIRRDGGRAFYGQERVGKGGRTFVCYKFRSMVVDADKKLKLLLESDSQAREEWEKNFKLKDDPRITRLGRFLRRTSLDELPQLWNVLVGEMSLVGPRPVVPDELSRYGTRQNYYLLVRPGMTGLWQVSGRNDAEYERRVALDTWYVKNWSVWTDVAILFKTVRVVCSKKGAY